MEDRVIIKADDTSLVAIIADIARSSARAEKERYLRNLADIEEGKRLIRWCYDPYITFGVKQKKEPEYRDPGTVSDWDQFAIVENLLTQLAARDLTGNAAKEAVQSAFESLNPAAGKLLWLCLNKDLKAGVAESTIKAIDPKLIPAFAVMRATHFEERLVKKFPVIVEPKLDGNRVTFIARNGSGGYFTRTGKVIESLDFMVADTLKLLKEWFANSNGFGTDLTSTNGIPDVMLDGEMMSDAGFDELNGALNRKGEDAGDVYYCMYDCLTWEEFDKIGAVPVPYAQRRKRLNSILTWAGGLGLARKFRQTPIRVCQTFEEVQALYEKFREEGQEGAMVKNPASFYEKKKSREWLKIKPEDTEDLMVIGVFQGQAGGKYEHTLGGLIVDRNGVEVRVSGISDEIRARIWSLWKDTAQICGFDESVGYDGASFKSQIEDSFVPTILLGRLIEVEFHEVTKDGSLRHPRFIRFRDDKTGEVDK